MKNFHASWDALFAIFVIAFATTIAVGMLYLGSRGPLQCAMDNDIRKLKDVLLDPNANRLDFREAARKVERHFWRDIRIEWTRDENK